MLTLIFPHSITANLAFPDQVFQQGVCCLLLSLWILTCQADPLQCDWPLLLTWLGC